MVVMLVDL